MPDFAWLNDSDRELVRERVMTLTVERDNLDHAMRMARGQRSTAATSLARTMPSTIPRETQLVTLDGSIVTTSRRSTSSPPGPG